MNGRKRFRWASIVILTLILTVALAPAAFAQTIDGGGKQPPPVTDPNSGGNGENTGSQNPPPSSGSQNPPPTGGNGNGGSQNPPPTGGNGGNGGNGGGGGTMAPSWPPSNMIVRHAATQVQLAPAGDGGLQAWFIAPGGVGHSGPYIPSFSSLATQYPTGVATLFTGANPGTGKPITIYYLASENKVRISTFYPDTQYDVNKPYVFTVDASHNVVHDQW